MLLEADAPFLFTIAFLCVTVCFVVLIAVLYRKGRLRKKSSVALFLLQWVFTALALFQLMATARPNDLGPMLTENVSYKVGWAGIYWAVSIVFLAAGLFSALPAKQQTDK